MIDKHHPTAPDKSKNYYGYIPHEVIVQENNNMPINSFAEITMSMIKHGNSKMVEETPQKKSRVSLGVVPEACYIIVVVPAACGYSVTKDNGMGGRVNFNEEDFGANGLAVKYNDIDYLIYGELTLISGERFIYID
jgi:hypothetical protein